MIADLNKQIQLVEYNFLNLPQKVTTDLHAIDYDYDAAGTKLRKKVVQGNNTTTMDYIGGIHYINGSIDFIQTAEGRADRASDGTYTYSYFISDHLGNNRVTINTAGIITQVNDYYPFGLTFNDYAEGQENLFKYNGKEEQEETGWYDYGARMYMPDIGRWGVIDPMSETYYGVSPYNFALNNPIYFIDPDGNFTIGVHKKLTKDALKKFGYSDNVRDLIGHYASVYADSPNKLIRFFSGMSKRSSIDYSGTKNSQDTSSPVESTRHSMEGDHESIGNSAAMRRGQKFGWKKIFEAAKEGTIGSYGENSKGAKAFGVGLHALQDSKVHKGVKFSSHDHLADLGNNQAEGYAASITESAVLVTEVLNGEYSNLESGTTLDVSGIGSKELSTLVNSVLKSGVDNVTLMNYHQKPEDSAQIGSGQIINQR